MSEREIKETILIYICIKKNKIPRNKLNKGSIKYSNTANCKSLMKEIKKTQINRKILHVHALEKSVLLKCPYDPKQPMDSLQSL